MAIDEKLSEEFKRYVKIGDSIAPQTADNMLIAYAYYKQALHGDNENERPTENSNVVRAFKHDAWTRLQGMPKEEAMKKYIAIIKSFANSNGED